MPKLSMVEEVTNDSNCFEQKYGAAGGYFRWPLFFVA
jgi:hypothetical protein